MWSIAGEASECTSDSEQGATAHVLDKAGPYDTLLGIVDRSDCGCSCGEAGPRCQVGREASNCLLRVLGRVLLPDVRNYACFSSGLRLRHSFIEDLHLREYPGCIVLHEPFHFRWFGLHGRRVAAIRIRNSEIIPFPSRRTQPTIPNPADESQSWFSSWQ